MSDISSRVYLRAPELVAELNRNPGSQIRFRRNGHKTMTGTLIRAELGSTELDDQSLPVVHVLMYRGTREPAAPVMISLVVSNVPDADYFWPICPIDVITLAGTQELALRDVA